MYDRHLIRIALLTGVFLVGFAVVAMADPVMLHPVHEGNATYVSGGVGDGEREALEASANDYNLKIINADPTGHYVSDTDIEITDGKGMPKLHAGAAGPLFYASLPAGEYTVQAMNGDQRKTQKVKIPAKGQAKIHFGWNES